MRNLLIILVSLIFITILVLMYNEKPKNIISKDLYTKNTIKKEDSDTTNKEWGTAKTRIQVTVSTSQTLKIAVNQGAEVKFENKESAFHIFLSDNPELNNLIIEPKATKTIILNTKGKFNYTCNNHSEEKGEIIVK